VRLSALLLSAVLVLGLALPAPAADELSNPALLTKLKRALKRGEAAELREAVNDIGRFSKQFSRSEQMTAAKALRKALEGDGSSEVRRLMIRALARMTHEHAWIPVILTSQQDRDPAVQAQARQEVLSGSSDELTAMGRILATETSAAFRAELLLILRDRRKPDAVPLLLERLGDKSPIVKAAAAEALEAISGAAHGYDVRAWNAWHAAWLVKQPKDAGPSVSSGGHVDEPAPHVTRSLHPSFYGLPLTAKDIVFVVDISGSVGSGGVGRAKQQLTKAVALLGSDVNIAALFFSDTVHMWRKGVMVPASPANKEDLMKFLRGLKPGRRTDVYTPLNAGLKILDRRVQAKRAAKEAFREPVTMITVSDGRDNMSAMPPRIIADKLDRLDPALSVLHCVVLGSKESPLMAAVARLGGGHYVRGEKP
jgi:hypothetical protein